MKIMKEQEEEFLDLNLELPDHKQDVKSLKNILIFELKDRVEAYKKITVIYDDDYYQLVDEILQILYKIGDMSIPIFKLRNELEDKYAMTYRHSPLLAKKLWQKHYHDLHKPYNEVKNICFNYLDILEEAYTKINKRKPIVKDRIIV